MSDPAGTDSGTVVPLAAADPSRLGSWDLEGRLGAGGMGVVYLGRSGGRLAAVKVVSEGLASNEEFRARFQREVAIGSRVGGPQVAELYDADTDAARPWLASRFVVGPTLEQAIARHGSLPDPLLRGLALALLAGLRAIHGSGVIHRDLKPSNVILTTETPVIIDFGIAGAADATALTVTGTMMGSPGWMAPEQVQGTEVTTAADIFSWASLLAYAGTGRTPFGAGRPEALAYRIVHGSPDLEGLTPSWRAVLEPALATDPSARPTVDALAEQLGAEPSPGGLSAAIDDSWAASMTAAWTGVRAVGSTANEPRGRPARMVIAGAVGVIALLGGVGSWALASGDDDTSKPPRSSTTAAPATSITPTTSTTISTTTSTTPTTSTSTTTTTTAPTTTAPAPAPPDLELAAGELFGIRFGTPQAEAEQQLIAQLGAPDERYTGALFSAGPGTNLRWGDLYATFYDGSEEVPGAELQMWSVYDRGSSERWETDRGIRMGASRTDVIAAYPGSSYRAFSELCQTGPSVLVGSGEARLEFQLDEDSRYVVAMGAPLLDEC